MLVILIQQLLSLKRKQHGNLNQKKNTHFKPYGVFLDIKYNLVQNKNYRKDALDLNFEQGFKADNQDIIEYFIATRNRLFRVQDRTFDNILKTAQKDLLRLICRNWGYEEELQQSLGISIQDFNKAKQLSSAKLSYLVLNEFIKSKDKPIIIVPQIADLANVCLRNLQQFSNKVFIYILMD